MDPKEFVTKFHEIYSSINRSIKQTFGLTTPRKLPKPAKIKNKVSKKLLKQRQVPLITPVAKQSEGERVLEMERKLDWLIKERMVDVASVDKSPFSLNPGFDLGASPTTNFKPGPIAPIITKEAESTAKIPTENVSVARISRIELTADILKSAKLSSAGHKIPQTLFQEMKSIKLRPTPPHKPLRQVSMNDQLLIDLQAKFKNVSGDEENLLEWSDSESLKGVLE